MKSVFVAALLSLTLFFSPVMAEKVLSINVERIKDNPKEVSVHAVVVDTDEFLSSLEAAIIGDHTKPLPSELIKEFPYENVIVSIDSLQDFTREGAILNRLPHPLPRVDKVIFFGFRGLHGPHPYQLTTEDGTPIEYREIDEARSKGDLAAALANPDYDPAQLTQPIIDVSLDHDGIGIAIGQLEIADTGKEIHFSHPGTKKFFQQLTLAKEGKGDRRAPVKFLNDTLNMVLAAHPEVRAQGCPRLMETWPMR